MSKRLFDFLFSFIGLLFLSPVFVITALMIKLDSKGPVFYKGERVGKNNKIFKMYKFRTMIPDADQVGGPSTAGDDPRLTRLSGFLKKYQLDELPQLINVFKGEMSLVGPRPEVKMYVDLLSEEDRNLIFSVKPGMTDFASLWNFHEGDLLKGSEDPERDYLEKIRPKKIELQKKYARERNLWVDFKIILKTISKIFK